MSRFKFNRGGIATFRLIGCLLFAGLLTYPTVLPAQQAKPDVAPPAAWVVPMVYNPRVKLEDIDPSEEMRWVLKDRQINAQNNEMFYHEARKILTVSGLNNGSHISVDYDPGYQLLTFHWVRIWRGTSALDRLDASKFQMSQGRLDTSELLFTDQKSALLILDDVRVGDVIEYAYTLQGANPVLAGRFAGWIEARTAAPIDRSRTRLLWPATRKLYVKNHGTDVKYTATRPNPNLIEFTWNFTSVPGWREELPLPVWYHPLPWIQLSEFQKWLEVNQFALGLFTNAAPMTPELTSAITEWKRLPTPEQRVLAALRFVQDDIRYMGIETGTSGYIPASPATVFERRFGDCKDKTLLLVTILRTMGIDARAALVNTRYRQSVEEMQPSAIVFDHAITRIVLDGQTYWLDATANYQRGPLATRSWPNYGFALVVQPGATALTPVAPCLVEPKTTVTQYIQLGRLADESSIKVVTVAEGTDAEQWRQEYATTTRNDIEKNDLNYYAKFYPEITQTAPLIYVDDEAQNKVEIDEFYTVRNIWKRQPAETYFHCQIFAENMASAVAAPSVSMRTMPLGVTYPRHQIFRAEVTVPPLSVMTPDDQTIRNPAFYFHRLVNINNGINMYMECEFRALSDNVAPDAVSTYVSQLNDAAALTGETVSAQ